MFTKINEPVIIKNSDFKVCKIVISFPIEDYKDEDIRILRSVICQKSEKYDTAKKVHDIIVNNYTLSYGSNVVLLGKSPFLVFSLAYPSFSSLGKDVLEDNLKFIREMIYNPYLEDGGFPKGRVSELVSIAKNNIYRNFKSASWYYKYKNDKLIDEDNFIIDKVVDDPSLLDRVNFLDLYNFYKKIIEKTPAVFLIGNVNEEKDKETIKNIILSNKVEEITFLKKYNCFVKNFPKQIETVLEKTSFKTSALYYNYKVRNMENDRDKELLRITKLLLSSNDSNILFNKLRQENDLVYRCGAYTFCDLGTLSLWAFTGKKNIQMVEEIYKKAIEIISDVQYIELKLPLLLEKAKLNDDLVKENIGDILIDEIHKYTEYKLKSDYELICDITPLEVSNFIKNRLVLVSKHILEGEENE